MAVKSQNLFSPLGQIFTRSRKSDDTAVPLVSTSAAREPPYKERRAISSPLGDVPADPLHCKIVF